MGIAEIFFGLFSVISIVSGSLAAIFIRRFNQQQLKQDQIGKAANDRSFVTNNQLGMVVSITIYNIALLIAKYNEVYSCTGKVSRWEGESQEGWFQVPVFIFLDLSIVNAIGWCAILWSRLTSANSGGLTRRFFEIFNTKRQIIFNRCLASLVILCHIIFMVIFAEDGGRLYLWCCILMIIYLSVIFIFNLPMSINLFFLIFRIRRQNRIANSEGSSALAGVIKVFIIIFFSVIVTPFAIFMTITSTILKRKDRISRNLKPDEVNALGDGIYIGPGITGTMLAYSLLASVLSIPFLFRKEFLTIVRGKKDNASSTKNGTKVKSITSASSKSATQTEIRSPQ